MIARYCEIEGIRRGGLPIPLPEAVEFDTLEWMWWFNYLRLLGPTGYLSFGRVEGITLPL